MKFESLQMLIEQFSIIDNKLVVDYSKPDGGINLKLGKNTKKDNNIPFATKAKQYQGATIYSAYEIDNKKIDRDVKDSILKSIKGGSNVSFSLKDYKHLLTRSALYLNKTLKKLNIDTVVFPESSSPLASDFADALAKYIPNVVTLPNAITKSKVDKVGFDLGNIDPDSEKGKQMTELLNTHLAKSTASGQFKMKDVGPQFRHFFKNFMQLDGGVLKDIEGKNVLLVDDVLTSGSTLSDSITQLLAHGAENVYGATLFRIKK